MEIRWRGLPLERARRSFTGTASELELRALGPVTCARLRLERRTCSRGLTDQMISVAACKNEIRLLYDLGPAAYYELDRLLRVINLICTCSLVVVTAALDTNDHAELLIIVVFSPLSAASDYAN